MEITMINSVIAAEGEFLAGKSYDIDDELADSFIVKGYASGDLSREYTDEEVNDISNTKQRVGI